MGSDQKRAIIAVILSGIVLLSWQAFFAPKVTIEPPASVAKSSNVTTSSTTTTVTQTTSPVVPQVQSQSVESVHLQSSEESVQMSSNLVISSMTSRYAKKPFSEIVGDGQVFQILFRDDKNSEYALNFQTLESSQSTWSGQAEDGTQVVFSLLESGRVGFKLTSPTAKRVRFVIRSAAAQIDSHNLRHFLFFTNDVTRENVGSNEVAEGSAKWFGLDYNYHLFSVIMPDRQQYVFRSYESGLGEFDLVAPVQQLETSLIFAQKDYDVLSTLGDNLALSVDFGIFGILAVPILRGLQFFHDFIPNYGIGIILLTLVIRLITFPLQYKSFKSMKKMQTVQPEIQKLREKFKDDPQRLQRETMELFKRAGANPLGGCLPLILQMPIFFAFYQVLYNAIELVGAPFYGWIGDLSVKDPYYILPVLMAVSMFLQQKLTPTTITDPTQKKVMTFMPLIFGFIMKDLPSGLVLYIFVSTLFGMAQQFFVYKTVD